MIDLILGDCLEVMPKLKNANDWTTVTSPPYNINKKYHFLDYRPDYIEWLVKGFREIRVLSKCFWLNVGYRPTGWGNVPIAFEIWNKVGMSLVQSITWEYGAGMTYRNRFNHRSEDWLWFVQDLEDYTFNRDAIRDPSLTKYKKDKRNNPNGKLPGDVWYFPHVAGTFKERCEHPAQYPLAMIERIILACTNEGDTVFDPFMGTGTTGVAAVRHNRNFVGIEIDPIYHELAKKRIEEAQQQISMKL